MILMPNKIQKITYNVTLSNPLLKTGFEKKQYQPYLESFTTDIKNRKIRI